MTPPDQPDDQPSALSRLERALAGFSDARTDTDAPAATNDDDADGAEQTLAPDEPDETDDRDAWDPPSEVASSPVLDIASAVEAVERLGASTADDQEGAWAAPSRSALEHPAPGADEFVFAATAAGTRSPTDTADELGDLGDFSQEGDELRGAQPPDPRAQAREFAEDTTGHDELRVGVDEGSDLTDAPPPDGPAGVTDAAESWSRDLGDAQLPYFLVEDNLPVATESTTTLEELRATVTEEKKRPASVARTLAEIPILLLVAALIAFLVKTFLAQAYYIPSGSMLPQLGIDDRVVVSKLSYKLHDPRRGDIVVFDDPTKNSSDDDDDANLLRKIGEGIGIVQPSTDEFIKRVIGLPGETVEGRDGRVYVNGQLLLEPYLPEGVVTADFDKVTVGKGRLWVMGDNRTGSADSRFFGQIDIDSIVGRAMVTVWPPKNIEFL